MIISFKAPLVEISTAFATSGFTPFLPSLSPLISLNCLLTSSIIAPAALPTAAIVNPAKTNGNNPPIIAPTKIFGLSKFSSVIPATVAYVARRANDVSTALVTEIPFPVAAVVLPKLSKASVLSLTLGSRPACSAIPPALSLTGPKLSVDKVIAKVLSIPTEANAIPYNPMIGS